MRVNDNDVVYQEMIALAAAQVSPRLVTASTTIPSAPFDLADAKELIATLNIHEFLITALTGSNNDLAFIEKEPGDQSVTIAFIDPVATLIALGGGLVLLFRRVTGDGRYFLLFWLFLWGLTFIFAGGKFTRYATSLMPAVIITAALAIQFAGRTVGRFCRKLFDQPAFGIYARAALVSLVIISTMWSAASASPHFRLYMNSLSGGSAKAGAYFPQDEFYDAYMLDALKEIATRARPHARVGTEIPIL